MPTIVLSAQQAEYKLAYGKHVLEYQKSAVIGASPLQLVVMLYDGALRFMEAGKHAMIERDIEKQNVNLQKAQRILQELTSCLDMQQGGDVAKNLLALYTFLLNHLVEANMEDDVTKVDTCIQIFSDLRESWSALEIKTRGPGDGGQSVAA